MSSYGKKLMKAGPLLGLRGLNMQPTEMSINWQSKQRDGDTVGNGMVVPGVLHCRFMEPAISGVRMHFVCS